MIRSLFPNRVFDLYTDLDSHFESYLPVENGTLTLDVPGFSKKDLSLEIDKESGLLTVNGEKEINGKKRSINKSIRHPKLRTVDLDKVEAKVQDGILTVYIKELEIKETKRQISLN
jgi:HSP20 family molecular chaperone IbpA